MKQCTKKENQTCFILTSMNPLCWLGVRNHLRPPSALRRQSYTHRIGPEMVSKFKLDHFLHVKKKLGPDIFLGPPWGPLKVYQSKIEIFSKIEFFTLNTFW